MSFMETRFIFQVSLLKLDRDLTQPWPLGFSFTGKNYRASGSCEKYFITAGSENKSIRVLCGQPSSPMTSVLSQKACWVNLQSALVSKLNLMPHLSILPRRNGHFLLCNLPGFYFRKGWAGAWHLSPGSFVLVQSLPAHYIPDVK